MSDGRRSPLLRGARVGGELTLDSEGQLSTPASTGTELDVGDTDEAADIVDRAQHRAEQLLRHAAERAMAIQHEAYSEGRQQGERDGRAAARAELAEALALVQRVGAEGKAVRDHLLHNAERELVELVIEATRAVIGDQTRLDTALVLDTVERALARAGGLNVVRVRVHPDDQQIVAAAISERRGEAAATWEVAADGTIEVGGCVIDTAGGEIDARLDVQLQEVARALRELIDGREYLATLGVDEGRRHVA